MNTGYMESTIRQFEYYKMLGEKTFAQLSDEQLFWCNGDETNSVALIIRHLCGDMMSRWTDFLTSNGATDWHYSDSEFDKVVRSREKLMEKWEEGWNCLFEVLRSLTDDNLQTIVYINHQRHTVLEAINQQLAHYPYHVGQIVCIGKMLAGDTWQSLSILRSKMESNEQD